MNGDELKRLWCELCELRRRQCAGERRDWLIIGLVIGTGLLEFTGILGL